jgi:hypothetical protein
MQCGKGDCLFDDLVGEDKDLTGDRQPDRLRGSEIEDQVELSGGDIALA